MVYSSSTATALKSLLHLFFTFNMYPVLNAKNEASLDSAMQLWIDKRISTVVLPAPMSGQAQTWCFGLQSEHSIQPPCYT